MAQLPVSEQEVETNSEESYLIVTGACASRIQEDIRALRNKTQQVDNMIQSNVQQVITPTPQLKKAKLRTKYYFGCVLRHVGCMIPQRLNLLWSDICEINETLQPASKGFSHALIPCGLTQKLVEGSGGGGGQLVSLIMIHGSALLFGVNGLLEFASCHGPSLRLVIATPSHSLPPHLKRLPQYYHGYLSHERHIDHNVQSQVFTPLNFILNLSD